MKVCFFGTYEKDYPSNRIIIKGLEKNNVNIIECHIALWERHKNKHGNFLKLFSLVRLLVVLIIAYLKLGFYFFKKCKNIDVIIVGYIGQLDIIFLKILLLFKKDKPKIIFAPLVSLYDTAIIDRELSGKKNIFAKLLFYLDKYSFKIADLIIFDTNEHINYISNFFNININKFRRVWVGADEDVFYPIEINSLRKKCHSESDCHLESQIVILNLFQNLQSIISEKNHKSQDLFNQIQIRNDREDNFFINRQYNKYNKFKILFIGKYIPLHGLEYIIEAAKLLENENDIEFKIIGNGQLDGKIMDLRKKLEIRNIDFIQWVEYNELVNEINKADVILGIFGGTDKSSRVIPNKIFQAIACAKPVITGDSLAIKELFTDKKNILLCENRNVESLRNAILKLKNNSELKEEIANNGYKIFKENATCKKIGEDIKK